MVLSGNFFPYVDFREEGHYFDAIHRDLGLVNSEANKFLFALLAIESARLTYRFEQQIDTCN